MCTSSETQGLLAGKKRYFRVKAFFKSWRASGNLFWIMCILSTPRPIYRSTSRSTYQPMYQPRYPPSDGRHIDRLSADISVNIAADTRPIRWPLIVGGISVDRRWYIGQKLRLLAYKLHAFHPFLVNLKNFWRLHVRPSCATNSVNIMQDTKSEILPSTQNTVDRKG